ncbi:MAG: hypothetical protein QOG31_310 [Thermoplasmata archaeon]|nr:hypothetical protein [Thermoplasmata archaeon]
MQGRTPQQWLDAVHTEFTVKEPAASVPATAQLDAAALQLYAAVGVQPDLTAVHAAASRIPLPVQGAVADLLGTVAQAYAEQAPVAREVALRFPAEARPDGNLLHPAERDAMEARAARIVAAINLFHARLDALAPLALAIPGPTCLVPVPTTLGCLAYLGSDGADTYASNPGPFPDPVLIAEPGGDDTYTGSAGGANPAGLLVPGNGLALSVVADVAGNDHYSSVGQPTVAQGSGSVGGLGLLVDAQGDDSYLASFTRTTVGPPLVAGVGLGYLDGGAQGTGYAGVGVLLDGWGDDTYDLRIASANGRCIWGLAQGFGGLGGLGVSSDLWGNDAWLSSGTGITGGNGCWGGAGGDAFQGLYPQGVGFYAGVGIMTDTGAGSDVYLNYNTATTTDYYAQGFGAFGGLGVLFEDGGNDRYVASQTATASWIDPTLNCAYGTGSLGGVGVMVDGGGDDSYLVETFSDKGAETMMEGDGEPIPGYGLFADLDGVDLHKGTASAGPGHTAEIHGRGVLDTGHNLAGTFLDAGSDTDTYVPATLGANNSQWLFGADL